MPVTHYPSAQSQGHYTVDILQDAVNNNNNNTTNNNNNNNDEKL